MENLLLGSTCLGLGQGYGYGILSFTVGASLCWDAHLFVFVFVFSQLDLNHCPVST